VIHYLLCLSLITQYCLCLVCNLNHHPGTILAHECTHAYLRLSGYPPDLPADVEEGLCQLLALLWLEQEGARLVELAAKRSTQSLKSLSSASSSSSSSSASSSSVAAPGDPVFERRLAAFFGHQIREDSSPIYGDGFRAALSVFQQQQGNLKVLLDNIRQRSAFQ
jgi:hypothetical protein